MRVPALIFLVVFLALCPTQGLLASPSWDEFRVTWPHFNSLPITLSDAEASGWLVDTDKACTAGSAQGVRAYLPTADNPLDTFLLFNSAGQIAGVQGASTIAPDEALSPKGAWGQDVVTNASVYTLTMYFRDPSTLCNGQTSDAKIGDGLWFAYDGVTATQIPQAESDLPVGSGTWGKGKCFISMGQHYWYNLSAATACSDVEPIFLLYNKGQLNGFGWATSAVNTQQPGSTWEHPSQSVLGLFFASGQQPSCFQDQGRQFSTMHFYFSNPVFDLC